MNETEDRLRGEAVRSEIDEINETIRHICGRVERIEAMAEKMTSLLVHSLTTPPECCAEEEHDENRHCRRR